MKSQKNHRRTRYEHERPFSIKIPLPRKRSYPMFQCGEDALRRNTTKTSVCNNYFPQKPLTSSYSMMSQLVIDTKSLFGVPVTWCASAYNEDILAGESWYTRFWCLFRDNAYNKCACNEYLSYMYLAFSPYFCTIVRFCHIKFVNHKCSIKQPLREVVPFFFILMFNDATFFT